MAYRIQQLAMCLESRHGNCKTSSHRPSSNQAHKASHLLKINGSVGKRPKTRGAYRAFGILIKPNKTHDHTPCALIVDVRWNPMSSSALCGAIGRNKDWSRRGDSAFTHFGTNPHRIWNTIDSHASIVAHQSLAATLKSQLIIGENNRIREYVTINRGTTTTRIGNDNWLMAYSVYHMLCHEMDVHSQMVQHCGHVVVGDNVIFGGLCVVHQWCRIGTGA